MRRFISIILSITMMSTVLGFMNFAVSTGVHAAEVIISGDFTSGSFVGENMSFTQQDTLDETRDSYTYNVEKEGVIGRHIDSGQYAYFQVDDTAITTSDSNLAMEVTYFDEGSGNISINYNSSDSSVAYPKYKGTTITLSNTGKWVTSTVYINDAAFSNSQNYGSDFRLANGNGDTGVTISNINISKVTVEDSDGEASISEDTLLLHGRTYYGNGELKLAWTNSGCTFNFTGTGATAVISTTNTNALLRGYINVYVDGDLVPTKTICLTQNKSTYVLAEGLTAGQHKITLRKRNEAAYGGSATIGISNISITDGSFLTPPEASERKIEIVGDSITSGFTNLIEDGEGSYSTENLEGTMTYAALTEKAFGADTNILSRSGIRFVRTSTGESMIDYYTQTSGLTGNTDEWDFGEGSDVVVINLGTNDNGAKDSNGNLVSDEYVQSEATELLKLVRSKNPNAVIVWAYGIMGNGRSSAIQAAVSSLGDSNIYYLPFDGANKETEGIAVGGHPTITTGINRSFDLVEFIAEKTGWSYNYDSQLATQLWLLRGYDDDTLTKYTHDSVVDFLSVRNYAMSLSNDSSAAVIKDAVAQLQAARNALVLASGDNAYDPDYVESGKCDLVVTDIYTDKTYYAGEEAVFVAKIKNQGTTASTEGIKHGLALFVDGQFVNWCDTYFGPMQPGEEVTLVMNSGPYDKNSWTVSAGTHTISALVDDQSLIDEENENNNEYATSITFIEKTTEEPTTEAPTTERPQSEAVVEINGYQISTVEEGFRTVYSIYDPENEIVSAGMLYGIGTVTEEDMTLETKGSSVYDFVASDSGKMDVSFSQYESAQSYSMTMKFAKTVSFYNTNMTVRAYAQLKDGSYIYSDIQSYTVYELADFLYQNLLMNSLNSHNYLYENILSIVDSSYKVKDFAWNNSIVKPGDLKK